MKAGIRRETVEMREGGNSHFIWKRAAGLLSDATLGERVRVENDFLAMRMTLMPTKTKMCGGRLGLEGR